MDYSYPLLNKILNHYKKDGLDLSNFNILSCQHLLAPQYEMYKMFIDFGLKPEKIIALGKIYSSNTEIIKELSNLGIKVLQPEFGGKSFDIEHRSNCENLVSNLANLDKTIVLDDGGYLIDIIKSKKMMFAVEQTSSGFRKLDGVNFSFPVINVARSKTKLTQESPLIGRLIFERTKEYIENNKIISPKILIVGLGPIGNAILEIFNESNSDVTGFDVEKNKTDIISYMKEEKPDLIIGATGSQLLDENDLNDLESDHTYHFISVSSSDREFPVAKFRTNNMIHDDVSYKNFVFVNNGFPITFKGNRYESTPIEIEKTIGLLMGSVLHGVTRGFGGQNGILEVPSELENLING